MGTVLIREKKPGPIEEGMLVISRVLPNIGDVVDQHFIIADGRFRLVSFNIVWTVASTSGTVTVRKCTGTQAPASGVAMLVSPLAFSGAANNNSAGTLATTRTGGVENIVLENGDRLSLDFGGTLTGIVGLCVTAVLMPIPPRVFFQAPGISGNKGGDGEID